MVSVVSFASLPTKLLFRLSLALFTWLVFNIFCKHLITISFVSAIWAYDLCVLFILLCNSYWTNARSFVHSMFNKTLWLKSYVWSTSRKNFIATWVCSCFYVLHLQRCTFLTMSSIGMRLSSMHQVTMCVCVMELQILLFVIDWLTDRHRINCVKPYYTALWKESKLLGLDFSSAVPLSSTWTRMKMRTPVSRSKSRLFFASS